MDLDDPRGDRQAFERELSKLDELDSTDDRDTIRSWGIGMATEYSTRQSHLQRVRTFSRRAPCPLVDLTESQYYDLLEELRDGSHPDVKDGGLAEGTLRITRSSTRLFFRDALDREWADDIAVGTPDNNTVSVDDLLVQEEVTRLFDVSDSARDSALIAILLSTGQRISAALSLRVDDVDLSGRSGTIHLNDDALGLKGASGPRPLTWATQYVATWLSVHPRRSDADAPLICTLKRGRGGSPSTRTREYGKGDPLSRFQAHTRLKRVAESADVDRAKVKPHNFRHTAITRMVRDGVPEQKIKWMVGWDKDSSQFKRYQHLDDDDMMQAFLEEYDLGDPDDGVGRPEITVCTRCDSAIRPGAQFCAGCGLPMTQAAAVSMDESDDEINESLATLPPEKARQILELIDIVDDPEVSGALLDRGRE